MTIGAVLLGDESTRGWRNTSSRAPGWLRHVLGISLQLKLLGANLIVFGVAAIVFWAPLLDIVPGHSIYTSVVIAVLAVSAAVNFSLVKLALRPVVDLQRVAHRVASGRLHDRVPASLLADPRLAQLGATINEMLDNLAAGREKMRKLAADVVYGQELERAQVARDLHDSVAQTLAAASFQITAASNDLGEDLIVAKHLAEARELLRTAQEEIRNVSRSLHPRVADDLGLPVALESLARSTRERSLLDVKVTIDTDGALLPSPLAGTLYRIAQEALRNVERHADAGIVSVVLYARPGIIELEVADDGTELFDAASLRLTGLDSARERLSLAGGELRIDSNSTGGTRVRATIKTDAEAA